MPQRHRPTRPAVALALAGLLGVAGCGGGTSGPVPTTVMHTRNDTGPSAAPLRAALVTAADLPATYAAFTPQKVVETSSGSPQNCFGILQQLEVEDTTDSGAQQVSSAFQTSPQGGAQLQHLLRSYPGDGAGRLFTSAVSTLTSCPTVRIDYADGSVIHEALSPNALPGLKAPAGGTVWSTSIEVSVGAGLTLHQITVLMRAADRMGVLTFVNPDPVDTAWATQLSDTLATRLANGNDATTTQPR